MPSAPAGLVASDRNPLSCQSTRAKNPGGNRLDVAASSTIGQIDCCSCAIGIVNWAALGSGTTTANPAIDAATQAPNTAFYPVHQTVVPWVCKASCVPNANQLAERPFGKGPVAVCKESGQPTFGPRREFDFATMRLRFRGQGEHDARSDRCRVLAPAARRQWR